MVSRDRVDTTAIRGTIIRAAGRIRVVKIRGIINLLSKTSTIKINLLRIKLGINLVLPLDQVNLLLQDSPTSISPVRLPRQVNPPRDNTIRGVTRIITKVPIKDTINREAKVTVKVKAQDSGVVATDPIPSVKSGGFCPRL